MGYECMIKVLDEKGKEVGRFPMTLYRSYDVGEEITTVEHGEHKVFVVVEAVTLIVKQIAGEPRG